MIYYLKFDMQSICKRLLEEELKFSGLEYNFFNSNELEINQTLSEDFLSKLNKDFAHKGIEIVSSKKSILIQKIKEAIDELINLEDNEGLSKTSYHLAKKLNLGYRYLSAVFSEVTYTSIESYIILQKIEKAKEMITMGEFTFSEIAWKLNYSSIGHFSMQFKNITGFTPTSFKKIIMQRRNKLFIGNTVEYNL